MTIIVTIICILVIYLFRDDVCLCKIHLSLVVGLSFQFDLYNCLKLGELLFGILYLAGFFSLKCCFYLLFFVCCFLVFITNIAYYCCYCSFIHSFCRWNFEKCIASVSEDYLLNQIVNH